MNRTKRLADPVQECIQVAVQANKDHQYALKVYTERIEAELETVNKLLAAADFSEHEDELEINAGGTVFIPGAIKASGPVSSGELLADNSPFRDEARRRERYMELTVIHQWKATELDALSEAVRSENYRLHALNAQIRGQQGLPRAEVADQGFIDNNIVGLDWERVAKEVSSSGTSTIQRSAKECEICWLGDRHPVLNHSPWTQSEIDRVRQIIGDRTEGQIDWLAVSAQLGTGRTAVDCMRHAIARKTHTWDAESDARLMHAVHLYGVDNWNLVARWVSEDATPTQCQSRYNRSLDPQIRHGLWTDEEDDMLREAVIVLGHAWSEVASFVPGRSNEQCRDRYNEVLNPSVVKGKWTPDEDKALIAAVDRAGPGGWKEIAKILGNGRTDAMCRNRYTAMCRKRHNEIAASGSFTNGSGQSQVPHLQVENGILQLAPPAVPSSSSPPRPRPRPRRKGPAQTQEPAPPVEMPTTVEPSAITGSTTAKGKGKAEEDFCEHAVVLTFSHVSQQLPRGKLLQRVLTGQQRNVGQQNMGSRHRLPSVLLE
ncbi:hypothetical protein WOLCODRAFT_69152 [Wolfiporia cocos MD-104 SS10]|uniref:Uncharacterized protein n=1 Tax=Wolfiporia cocos (strain MD-104) TaxID=742152 RepID=A0A2H3JU59_WOLCO|nr:hypothetical protein WOLCODRAFT_69152 [Wolfiporia cocos MD-104 SS10]